VERTVATGDIQRVRWREGQQLDASDLADEQAYLAGLGHRHATGPHEWGIVTGLELTAARQGLLLGRGLAVDGYGHQLVVRDDQVVHWPAVEPPGDPGQRPAAIDVWLRYCRVAGAGRDRVREEARLRLTAAPSQPIDPRRPPGVPAGDLAAQGLLAEEPERVWPVYLGRLVRLPKEPDGTPPVPPFRLASARRPYAGLRGASVEAPSEDARLELGGTAADRRRLAILTADDKDDKDDKHELQRRVDLDADGTLSVNAGAELRGTDLGPAGTTPASLRLAPGLTGQPRSSAWLTFAEPLPPPPTRAWPWRLYRTKVNVDDRELDQLRIEIQHPGETDDPSRYRLVVGQWRDGRFDPSLTVSADGTVTVEGTLVPRGPVTQGAVGAVASGLVLDDILRKLAAGSITIDAAFGGARVETGLLRIDLDAPAGPEDDTAFQYTLGLVNLTTGLIGHIEALQTISFDLVRGNPLPVVSGLSLAGGADEDHPQQIYIPPGSAGHRLTIDAVALGLATTGTVAYAALTRTWIVNP
jgi:hypothetical protein